MHASTETFLQQYRAAPKVAHALEHEPAGYISTHYAALAKMLTDIETVDLPRTAKIRPAVRAILRQDGLSLFGRCVALYAFLRIRSSPEALS